MTDYEKFLDETILAPFLLLLILKLTHYTGPTDGGGDPTYLTGAQAEALAVEGVELLARYLPEETAQRVTSAVEHLTHPRHRSREQMLLRVGALGGVVLPHSGGPDSPPGCCVFEPGRGLVCVR